MRLEDAMLNFLVICPLFSLPTVEEKRKKEKRKAELDNNTQRVK